MEKYVDNNFKELKKGFYKLPDSDELFYFTGNYEAGLAVFEKESEAGEERLLLYPKVHELSQVDNNFALKELEDLKKKTNWLEKKLNKNVKEKTTRQDYYRWQNLNIKWKNIQIKTERN